jgi:hypothetical protein
LAAQAKTQSPAALHPLRAGLFLAENKGLKYDDRIDRQDFY